jgi:hypothetical protein
MTFSSKISPEIEQQLVDWVEQGLTAGPMRKLLRAQGIEITRQGLSQKLHRMGHVPHKLRADRTARKGRGLMKDTDLLEFVRNHHDEVEMKADLLHHEESASMFRSACLKKFREKGSNARSKGQHAWEIEFEDVYFPLTCPVLGIKLDYYGRGDGLKDNVPSFDRLDASFGYVPGNVVVMSMRANRLKNDGSADEHRAIADFLDSYHETAQERASFYDLYEFDDEELKAPSTEEIKEQERRAGLPEEYKKCGCCGEYKKLNQFGKDADVFSYCVPCRDDSVKTVSKKRERPAFDLHMVWGAYKPAV